MMKRILFIPYYFYPDISAISQLFTEFILKLSSDKKYEITVLSTSSEYYKDETDWEVNIPDNVIIQKLKATNFKKNNMMGKLINYLLFYIKVFIFLIFKEKYDCVVTLTLPPLIQFSVGFANLFRNTKMIFYVQDLYPEILYDLKIIKNPWIVRRLKVFNKLAIKKSAEIITIGSYMKRKIENYNIPGKRISIIHNWPNMIEYNDPQQKDVFEILYSGNIGIPHDLSIMEDLISVPYFKEENIYFHFVGGGKNYNKTCQLFDNKEIYFKFEPYAPIEEVSKNLSNASVLMLAQKKDSVGDIVPSKFYSYLASGRPMIFFGPKNSEIGEILITNEIGIVLENSTDIDNVISYIKKLNSDFENYRNICRRIKHFSEKYYSINNSLNQFKVILDGVFSENEKK